jgi:hypothetical protein
MTSGAERLNFNTKLLSRLLITITTILQRIAAYILSMSLSSTRIAFFHHVSFVPSVHGTNSNSQDYVSSTLGIVVRKAPSSAIL